MTNCSIFRKQTPNLRRIKIKSALTQHKDTAKYHKIFLKAKSWGEKGKIFCEERNNNCTGFSAETFKWVSVEDNKT